MPDDIAHQPAGATVSTRLLGAGVAAGILGMLPFFVTPELDTARAAEVADHVVPGLLVLVAAGAVVLSHRRGRVGAIPFLAAGLAILLAGIWMVSTHVPLLNQARRGDAPWGASLYHSASAVIVLAVGVAWSSAAWTQAD
ncbi:MAG TPA: hypothetical protein VG455_14015 [Acidimicrobiales bacterium]|nr:hypothetical protein [Acidimicrobiales bacterium]